MVYVLMVFMARKLEYMVLVVNLKCKILIVDIVVMLNGGQIIKFSESAKRIIEFALLT